MTSFNGKGGGVFVLNELETGEITVYVEDSNGHHAQVVLPDNSVVLELYNIHKERLIRLKDYGY